MIELIAHKPVAPAHGGVAHSRGQYTIDLHVFATVDPTVFVPSKRHKKLITVAAQDSYFFSSAPGPVTAFNMGELSQRFISTFKVGSRPRTTNQVLVKRGDRDQSEEFTESLS